VRTTVLQLGADWHHRFPGIAAVCNCGKTTASRGGEQGATRGAGWPDSFGGESWQIVLVGSIITICILLQQLLDDANKRCENLREQLKTANERILSLSHASQSDDPILKE